MCQRLLQLPLALLLALGAAGAHAQSGNAARDAAVLPVWNNATGKVEAVLLLEPTGAAPTSGARWRAGSNTLEAAFGLSKGDTLGVVCNRQSSMAAGIGNLLDDCNLAAFGSGQAIAGASMNRGGDKLGITLGSGRDTLPAWLTPTGRTSKLQHNSLTLSGQKNVGREATVSIGGTWARARLIPAGEVPALADRWNSKSLVVGANMGNFGANITGRVVDTAPGRWEGVGVGLTWRTPWSGELTVGAENVVTRGKNPFSPRDAEKDEGTVPYVRYEQDL